jgi:hypothetical protein
MRTATLASLAEVAKPCPVILTFIGDPELGNPTDTEYAILLDTAGDGDDLRVTFRSNGVYPGETYEWEAYMFEGRLSYGTSAEELRVQLQDPS